MKPYKTDETGVKILEILTSNARASVEEIGQQMNLEPEKVDAYIKKFEKDRIILGYRTSINWQRIKQYDVKALIEVKVTPERNVGFDAIAEQIFRFPEVSSLSLVSGTFDLLVQVEGENLMSVARFVSEKLSTLKGVQSSVSHFLLKKYKEEGIIFEEQPSSKRLPVVP
jgi:DNA-binding Lrp family transcriptional regulator